MTTFPIWGVSRIQWSLLFALLGIFILRAWSFHYLVDDAYISLRYARNLYSHHELVYNPGERVEGITNLLWTVILVVPEFLHTRQEVFAQNLGIAFGIGTSWLTLALGTSRRTLTFGESWLVALFVTALAPLPLWSQSGLETGCCAFVFVLVVALVELRNSWRKAVALGVLSGVAFCLRPDGAIVLAFALVIARREKRNVFKDEILTVATFLSIVISVSLFRHFYFQSWLPNTFFAKRSFLSIMLADGVDYAGNFGWRYLLCPMVLALTFAASRRRVKRLLGAIWLHPYFACICVYALYVIQAGGDWMPYSRFFVPIMPMVFLMIAEGAKATGLSFQTFRGVACVTGVLLLCLQLERLGDDYRSLHYNRDQLGPSLERVAAALNRLSNHPKIALGAAGLVPYRTGLLAIDLFGLNDARVAHSVPSKMRSIPGHYKTNAGYIVDHKRPDVVFFDLGNCLSSQPLSQLVPWGLERLIVQEESFLIHYEISSIPSGDRFVNFYRRID